MCRPARSDPSRSTTPPRTASDPRAQSPFTAQFANSANGLVVVPGDGTVSIDTLRDLVLAGAGDPTRQVEEAETSVDAAYLPADAKPGAYAGVTGFSLWTPATAIDLFSAGGNLTPTTAVVDTPGTVSNDAATDYSLHLSRHAGCGRGQRQLLLRRQRRRRQPMPTSSARSELAPSPTGELSFIAAQSIYGQRVCRRHVGRR